VKGSIRERRPKVWNLCVELPPGPGGQRRQKNFTVYGAKRDAQRRLREILTEMDQGKFTQPGKVSVGQYLTQWLEQLTVSPTTQKSYGTCCRLHLIPALGHLQLTKLTKRHIEECYGNLARDHAPSTIRQFHRILTIALNDAIKRNLIFFNPAADAKRPTVVREEARFLEADELDKVLKSLQGSIPYPAVLLGATTGLRVAEVAGLKWTDLVFNRSGGGKLSVRRIVVRLPGQGDVVQSAPKTKHSRRTVSLPPVTVKALRAHRWWQYRTYQPLGFRPEFVFTSMEGGIASPDVISQTFSRACKRLGIEATFHALRQSYAQKLWMSS
jgi:integrase